MPEVVEGQIEIKLDHYPDRFLTCRALQHMWVPTGLPLPRRQEDSLIVYETFKCSRCDTQRTDQRTAYGRLLRRHYRHESGYRMGADAREKALYAHERLQRILGRGFENQPLAEEAEQTA